MKINSRYEVRVVIVELLDEDTLIVTTSSKVGDISDNLEEFKRKHPYCYYKFGYVVYDTELQQVPDNCNSYNDSVHEAIMDYEKNCNHNKFKSEGNNMIKRILKEAGRYDEIVDVLNNISKETDVSKPVNAFVDYDGKTKWRIDGKLLKYEASKFLQIISAEEITEKLDIDYFNELLQYIHTKSDTLLHNYAVSISHRNEPEIDMEYIRSVEILENLLYNLNDYKKWYIPDGWKKID